MVVCVSEISCGLVEDTFQADFPYALDRIDQKQSR